MNTCETCKFWMIHSEYDTGYNLGLKTCTNITMFYDSTEWSEDGEERVLKEACKDKKAFAQDASDYRAILVTKGNFGCIDWSEKV